MAEPRYETQSFTINYGLNYYHQYLSTFGWEIIGQQKINYWSTTTSWGSSKTSFFSKNHASHDINSSTVHLYYTELTIKRKIGMIPDAILKIEWDFFENLRLFVSPWVDIYKMIKIAFFSFVISWIILMIYDSQSLHLVSTNIIYLSILPPLAIITYLAQKLWSSYMYKNHTYPEKLQNYMEIIKSNTIPE